MMEKGVETMIRVAMRILKKKSLAPVLRMMLTEGDATDEEQDKEDGLGDQPGT
jgi:hypothetical protein